MSPAFEESRHGGRTVRIGNRYLHSRYDPEREATQFVARLPESERQGTVIVLGDGLGVIGTALRAAASPPRVISLEVTNDAAATPPHGNGFLRIPAAHMSVPEVRSIIRQSLSTWETPLIHVLIWPAAASILPDWMRYAQQGVVQAIRDLQSELATVAVFGRRWLANAIAGTISWDQWFSPRRTRGNLALATSGPSLQTLTGYGAGPGIRAMPVIATSSALRWLNCNGYTPSLVVHTDGGVWADRYFRDLRETQVVAIPLRAGTRKVLRPWPYRTGWIGEKIAIDAADWPRLQEQPTVGATLLVVGEAISQGGCMHLAGLDLCTQDLVEHARPHRNDSLIAESSGRLTPEVTVRAGRVWPGATRVDEVWPDGSAAWQGYALATYQQMIQEELSRLRGSREVRTVSSSPVMGHPVPWQCAAEDFTARLEFVTYQRPARAARRDAAEKTLTEWREIIGTKNVSSDPRMLPGILPELLTHLAPTEFIQWVTSQTTWDAVTLEAQRALSRLVNKARHYV